MSLHDLHVSLCHPGITRLLHYVRSKHLPYTAQDVKKVVDECRTCAVCKPRYHQSPTTSLVRALQPFDRLSIDFKGPLPETPSGNRYLLVIVDEFSRFPFAYPCKDLSSRTVIAALTDLFGIFGFPNYIHSDNGSSLIAAELKKYLLNRRIAANHSTPCH